MLVQCYKAQINCEGVKPCYVTAEHKTELYTKFTCCCGHATFFVSCYTKEQRKLRRRNRQRLYSTESDLSVVVLAWSDTGNTYKYFTLPWCNGDKRPTRAYVACLHPMVSVLCLTIAWRSQATRLSETKETCDISLASDWLSKLTWLVTRAKVSRMFYH